MHQNLIYVQRCIVCCIVCCSLGHMFLVLHQSFLKHQVGEPGTKLPERKQAQAKVKEEVPPMQGKNSVVVL